MGVAGGHTMKGTKVCLVFPLFVGMAFALSFQGQEEVKSNMIFSNEAFQHQKPQEDSTESVSDKQDLIKKRSLNVPDDMDEAYFTNAAITTLGAILNRDDCRKTIVCNACNAVKSLVPVSQVGIVLADHYLPPDLKNWDKYAVA